VQKLLDDSFTAASELLARLSLMNMPVFQALLAELSAESHRNVFLDVVAAMSTDLRVDDDRKQFWSIPHARVVGLALTQFIGIDAGDAFIPLLPGLVDAAALLVSHWEAKSDLPERKRVKYLRKCRLEKSSPSFRKWEESWTKDPLTQNQQFNPIARLAEEVRRLPRSLPCPSPCLSDRASSLSSNGSLGASPERISLTSSSTRSTRTPSIG
jgi:hypothetical protein